MFRQNKPTTYSNVVGNISASDESYGYKKEVKGILESYTAQGTNLINDLGNIIMSPTARAEFIDSVTESMADSALMTNAACQNNVFYGNYVPRVEQLLNNTCDTIAMESVMTGYAPIVAYNPFFLKKQWIENVFKDVLMTEVPKTPVIEIGFEKRYLKTLANKEYPLPESLYDDVLVKELMDEATGLNFTDTPIAVPCSALNLIDPTYIPGVIAGDTAVELTQNIAITAVEVSVPDLNGSSVPVVTVMPIRPMTVDVSTHNFVNGTLSLSAPNDPNDPTSTTPVVGTLAGGVDFVKGTITVLTSAVEITGIVLSGKIANRFNNRSLDVVRRVEKIEKTMPESGPRLNAAITIEDAADALALQNIDVIADNVNIMGSTLANFEDAEIKLFLNNSFDAQKAAKNIGIRYNELDDSSMIVEGAFNASPAGGYSYTITEWMKSSREYFERIIGAIKLKLRSTNMVIVAVANPNIIRFLQDGINWVFSDDTQISGVKLSYQFGIYTSGQDRVHVLTSQRMKEDEGIKFVAIPLTQELMTFKHYKYSVVIDRNYRNPKYTLTPNIMCTQRTLTFEIFPVQGKMEIDGRSLFSPEKYGA